MKILSNSILGRSQRTRRSRPIATYISPTPPPNLFPGEDFFVSALSASRIGPLALGPIRFLAAAVFLETQDTFLPLK